MWIMIPAPARWISPATALSYDGHTGTDFALPSLAAMQAGVAVTASPPPRQVAALRDGMPDTGLTPETATISTGATAAMAW
jgi:hypothetical protein